MTGASERDHLQNRFLPPPVTAEGGRLLTTGNVRKLEIDDIWGKGGILLAAGFYT